METPICDNQDPPEALFAMATENSTLFREVRITDVDGVGKAINPLDEIGNQPEIFWMPKTITSEDSKHLQAFNGKSKQISKSCETLQFNL